MFDWEPTGANLFRAVLAIVAASAWALIAHDVSIYLYKIGSVADAVAAAFACLYVSYLVFDWNWPK